MRKIHKWPDSEAKHVKALYGLRKKYTFKKKRTATGKKKDYHYSKACPVDGCRSVTKTLARHLQLSHNLDKKSVEYKHFLSSAVTVDEPLKVKIDHMKVNVEEKSQSLAGCLNPKHNLIDSDSDDNDFEPVDDPDDSSMSEDMQISEGENEIKEEQTFVANVKQVEIGDDKSIPEYDGGEELFGSDEGFSDDGRNEDRGESNTNMEHERFEENSKSMNYEDTEDNGLDEINEEAVGIEDPDYVTKEESEGEESVDDLPTDTDSASDIMNSFYEYLTSADNANKNEKSALDCKGRVYRILKCIDQTCDFRSLLDPKLIRDIFLKHSCPHMKITAKTIQAYLKSLQHFYDFLLCENFTAFDANMLNSLKIRVEKWKKGYTREVRTQEMRKLEEERRSKITPKEILQFVSSDFV